jgi:hypothetical protein
VAVGGMWHYACGGRRHPRATFGTRKARAKHAQKHAPKRSQANARQGNAPDTWTTEPSTLSKRASVSPTGFGRWGERVANTPIFAPSSRGGCTCGRSFRAGCSPHACMRAMPRGQATARGADDGAVGG